MYTEKCKNCDFDLDGGDILEVLKSKFPHKETEELEEWASGYGWSKEKPEHFSKKVGIYDLKKDEISYYVCPHCKEKI